MGTTNAAATIFPGSKSHFKARGAGLEKHDCCTWPYTPRKEWRAMNMTEKKAYTDAVLCLTKKPSKAHCTIKGAKSRYDDFQGIHSAQTDFIHWVGHFLPWHRYHLATFEKALREECEYKYGLPYWDWTIDTKSGKRMDDWPVFDAATGLGGNGPFIPLTKKENPFGLIRTGGGCVRDGPFTWPNFVLNLGPTKDTSKTNPHCLTRDFAPTLAAFNLLESVVDETMSQPDFGSFTRRVESVPSFTVPTIHGGGHFSVGGVLGSISNAYNSPADPIFWLHHANLDRIWWNWQKQMIWSRTQDISGPIVPFDYENKAAGNVTLDFKVNLGEVGAEVQLWELMHIQEGVLCYDYI